MWNICDPMSLISTIFFWLPKLLQFTKKNLVFHLFRPPTFYYKDFKLE